MPGPNTTDLLEDVLRIVRDHDRSHALIYARADLSFRVFELSSHDEGAGDAMVCVLEGDVDIPVAELCFLMIFRLWAFAEFETYEDLLTGDRTLGWLFEEIHRDLSMPAEGGLSDARPVKTRLIDHVSHLSSRLEHGSGSGRAYRPYRNPDASRTGSFGFANRARAPHRPSLTSRCSTAR